MAPPKLIPEFPAMKPQLVFPAQSYREVEGTWAQPLKVIHRAIIALTEDATFFQITGHHQARTAASEAFVCSLSYYVGTLVQDPFLQIEHELEFYSYTPALSIHESDHSIGFMLANARNSFQRLSKIMMEVSDTAGWEFRPMTPSAGDMVPTACPYQLLYQMICMEKLSSAPVGDQITRTFLSLQKQARLALPGVPLGIARVTSDAPCGRPTMIFVAGTLDLSRIVFGANETAWGELTAVSAITRMARDIRLQHYVPPAMAAFQALRRKEMEALAELQKDAGGTSVGEDLLWSARSKAIEQMRSDDSFLGGENEMGIALRPPTWSINQGCYLCQGMMGYQSPKSWNENQRRKYILKFD